MGVLPYMENDNLGNENKKENSETFQNKTLKRKKELPARKTYQRVKLDEDILTWKEVENLEKELSFLKDVKLRFFVEIDRKKMRFEEIYNLKPGEIITLNRKLEDYITIFLKNIIFGVGELVNINDNFGVRLIDIRVERFLKDLPGKD